MNFQDRVSFIWGLADLLRGDYKEADYAKVILPFTLLRRLDCTFDGPDSIARFIAALSPDAQEIIDGFEFQTQLVRLREAGLLNQMIERFAQIDLHPDTVSNHEMGSLFEELIRRFSEQSGASAGEHFTPREVIRLMVDLLLQEQVGEGDRSLYDPACGTGGMLSVAEECWQTKDSLSRLEVFGQEINRESYAICKADLLLKGANPGQVRLGNTFSDDQFAGRQFDYMLSNPPFGVEWKRVEAVIRQEHEQLGWSGRFGAGLPRVSDGSLLFLQHMLSKMNPEGSRLALVFNGSPLFAGDAGSGESEIRRWILQNDWLESIIALPDQLFYNTGLSTYIWILTNRKSPSRKGKVQLIDAAGLGRKMRRSLGAKRKELGTEDIGEIIRLHAEFRDQPHSRILANEDFLYRRIVVERPLRLTFELPAGKMSSLGEPAASILCLMAGRAYSDQAAFEQALAAAFGAAKTRLGRTLKNRILHAAGRRDPRAAIFRNAAGRPEADAELRDCENVPWPETVPSWFAREVAPYVPDAWVDESRTRIGCDIPFTRIFFEPQPLRPLAELDREVQKLDSEIQCLLQQLRH